MQHHGVQHDIDVSTACRAVPTHRTALQVVAKLLEIQKVDEGQSLLVLPAVLTHSV